MRLAALGLATLLLAVPARAQDEAIDGDFRVHDRVVVEGVPEPLVGTILEGRDGGPRLKIRTVQGVVTEFPRDKVREVIPRETPESAFRARSARIKERGTPGEHRLLAEWGLKHGLLDGAEAEMALAADREKDPARSREHRERLVELLERRLPDQPADGRDAIREKILRQAAKAEAGGASARLDLARARVALALGLNETARVPLQRARAALEAKLQAAPPPSTDTSAPPPQTEAPEPRTETAPPPRRTFNRDGEALDPGPKEPPAPPPSAPEPPIDRSDVELAGLAPAERDAWRSTLLLLAEVELRAGKRSEAQEALERVLEVWPQEREACLVLARLHVSRGQRGAALDLLAGALKAYPIDAELLLCRGQVRTLLRDPGATDDLTKALTAATQQAQPDESRPSPPGTPPPAADSPLVRDVRTALGLAHLVAEPARFKEAGEQLVAADAAPGHGPARLGRALLAECQGNAAEAKTHYEEAARLLVPRGGEARYGLAFVRAEQGDAQGARAALREALREGFDVDLTLRALEDLAARRGDAAEELRLLEVHARQTSDPSPDLLARLGRAYLREERVEEARSVFERGLAEAADHVGCLRGLAWVVYRADDRPRARDLFTRLTTLDPEDEWAKRGLKQLDDTTTRRMWTDAFDRAGPEVKNSWTVEASWGVKVELVDGRCYFSGKQANDAGGKTRLARTIKGETLVRFEARLALDRLAPGVRAGIRLEAVRGADTGPGVVLFRDGDGRLKLSLCKTPRGGYEDPVDLGDWPGTGLRPLAIELEDPKTGAVAIWIDGQRRPLSSPLTGLGGDIEVSAYVQGNKLDVPVDASIDDVRLFIAREAGSTGGAGGGY